MKILILEDNEYRIDTFTIELKGHDIDHTDNVEICKNRIRTTKYDLIFLDHDLGGEIFVDSDVEQTGYHVAKIIPYSINRNTKVIIHTHNPPGGTKMKEVIGENAFCKPFGTFKIKGEVNEI